MMLRTLALALLMLPPGLSPAQTVETNIRFGALPQNRQDLYLPETVTDATPVLVFFYGGGWSSGDKSQLATIGESFAQAGVIFVAPNYRLYPDAAFPGFIEDSAAATAWAWQTLRQTDDSPRRVYVGGWSAGAYNAGMVALNGNYLSALGVPEGAVSGFVGLAGPYAGGTCAGSRCTDVFPEPLRADWTLPDFVTPGDPPMLLVTGGQDQFVAPAQRDALVVAAEAAGVPVTVLDIADADHGDLLMLLRVTNSDLRAAALDFLAAP